MRSLFFYLLISVSFISSNCYIILSQDTNNRQLPPDTIITKAGNKIIGHIENKTKFEIIIRMNNNNTERVNHNIIKEIFYGNGTYENIEARSGKTTKDKIIGSVQNWTEVIIANEGSNLSGYTEKEEIEVKYVGTKLNTDNTSLERNCLVLLRKRAAALGGRVIKVTQKSIIREYGEFPYIIMKAKVYSIE